jgi:hypothetical protein
MYEHFTDRAVKVMQLATQEAQWLNHEHVGTGHILLGLVKERCGVAAHVLKKRGLQLPDVRAAAQKIAPPGPDVVRGGKLPFTPRARAVIGYAHEEARSLNHHYVGTEHLLLGLLREGEGVAAQVLSDLGQWPGLVRLDVLDLLGRGTAPEEIFPAKVVQMGRPLFPPDRPAGGRQRLPRRDALGEAAILFAYGLLATFLGAFYAVAAEPPLDPTAGSGVVGLLYLAAVAVGCLREAADRARRDDPRARWRLALARLLDRYPRR